MRAAYQYHFQGLRDVTAKGAAMRPGAGWKPLGAEPEHGEQTGQACRHRFESGWSLERGLGFECTCSPPYIGTVAQGKRARRYERRGRGFETLRSLQFSVASVAQLVEHRTENPGVAGSNPARGTRFNPLRAQWCGRTQTVRDQVVTLAASGFDFHRSPHCVLRQQGVLS